MSSSDLSDDDVGGDTLSLTSISSHISDVLVMPSRGADDGLGDDGIVKTDSAAAPKEAPSLLLTPQQWMDKQDAIEECLRGGGAIGTESAMTDSIDLWHLRELCIAPGGLLDPSLRKRAWPLLTQALLLKQSPNPSQVEVSSTSTSNSTVEPVTPSANDILLLQRDVRYTVWNVLESFHIQQQKGLKKQSRSAAMTASSMSNMPRRVTFATVQTLPISPVNVGEEIPLEGTSNAKENENQSPTSVAAVEAMDTADIGTAAPSFTFEEGVVVDTPTLSLEEERSISSSSRSTHRSAATASRSGGGGHAYRKASPPEQKILTNVVTSCLRVAPPESDAFEDDRFRYYTGLHDLTALMMVNMESPSLTSLVLGKLATFHLRDAMRKDGSVLEAALDLSFYPLLQDVDLPLYHFIVHRAGVTLPTFAMPWIANWFATDVMDIGAASRLLDFLLVSHASAVVYVAVALVSYFRQDVLQCEPELSSLYATLRKLPHAIAKLNKGDTVAPCENTVPLLVGSEAAKATTNIVAPTQTKAMAAMEHIIAKAVAYMKRFPPEALAKSAAASARGGPDPDALMSSPTARLAMWNAAQFAPSWCTANTSPTEWSMLQGRTKTMGENDDTTGTKAVASSSFLTTKQRPSMMQYEQLYPLAVVAVGLVPHNLHSFVSRDGANSSKSFINVPSHLQKVLIAIFIGVLVLSLMGLPSLWQPVGEQWNVIQLVNRNVLENVVPKVLRQPFHIAHNAGSNRLAATRCASPTVSKGVTRSFGKDERSVSFVREATYIQRIVVSTTRQLINLPLQVAGIPFAMLTSALDSAMYLMRLLHKSLAKGGEKDNANSGSTNGGNSLVAAASGKFQGIKVALARMQRRVSTVVEAALWMTRGEPAYHPKQDTTTSVGSPGDGHESATMPQDWRV